MQCFGLAWLVLPQHEISLYLFYFICCHIVSFCCCCCCLCFLYFFSYVFSCFFCVSLPYFAALLPARLFPFCYFDLFLPSISTAWPKYFCLSIYTTYTKINVYIHELTSRTLCWLRPPCPPTPLSTTYLLLTACLVIVLVWPFVSKLLTMDVAK